MHGVHFRCGLPARRTAKAARCLEGFDGFVTSAAAPIATGWSDQLSGQELHLLKIRAFSRRTATHAPLAPIAGGSVDDLTPEFVPSDADWQCYCQWAESCDRIDECNENRGSEVPA